MKIEQLELENENLVELLKDDEVYYMKVTFRELKGEILPFPWGLSFSRLNTAKFRELFPQLESGEVVLVRVRTGE